MESCISLIEVFDASFIADNLFAGESVGLHHDRGLFGIILGRGGVKLARQQEFFNGAAKKTGARLKETETALNNDIPSDHTREEFFGSLPPENIDEQIAQAQKDLKAIQQSERLSKLKRLGIIEVPSVDFNVQPILERTLQDIEVSTRGRLSDHFLRFKLGKEGEGWIKFGLEHIHDDTCPFCAKPDVDGQGLVTLYNQIFGEMYQSHLDSIKTAAAQIEMILGNDAISGRATTASANADAILSWSEFVNLDANALPKVDDALRSFVKTHELLKQLFDAKRESPLSVVSNLDVLAEAKHAFDEAVAVIIRYNDAVKDVEAAIAKNQAETPMSEAQAMARVSNLTKRKRRTDPGVQLRIDNVLKIKSQDDGAKRLRTGVQKRFKKANVDAAAHYYDKVHDYLDKFEASFRISQFTNNMAGNAGAIDYGLIVLGLKLRVAAVTRLTMLQALRIRFQWAIR